MNGNCTFVFDGTLIDLLSTKNVFNNIYRLEILTLRKCLYGFYYSQIFVLNRSLNLTEVHCKVK